MNAFILPGYVEDIISGLEKAGFEAYLVGGCVRDTLLGHSPHDYDVATGALPEEITRTFVKTVPTGVRYGTVTVLAGAGKAEVTTFRSEAGYDDCRRPSSVTFGGGILGDLSRRDFTVNAIAYNPRKGLADPFFGRKDIGLRVIRAVGEPEQRFGEDALRILRAFRFAAQLGFELEEKTLQAAAGCMPLTAGLSGERVRAELEKLLMSGRPSLVFEPVRMGLFDALGVAAGMPERGLRLDVVPASSGPRWAAFIYLARCDAGALFNRLKFDNAAKDDIVALLNELAKAPPEDEKGLKHRLKELGPRLYMQYLHAYGALTGDDISIVLGLLDGILGRGEPFNLGMLALRGEDLIAAGFEPGPQLGRAMGSLLDYAIENPGENNKEALLSHLKDIN